MKTENGEIWVEKTEKKIETNSQTVHQGVARPSFLCYNIPKDKEKCRNASFCVVFLAPGNPPM